jgi:hypothetical protein
MHACMIIQLFANNKFYSKILIEHNSGNCGKSKWEKKKYFEKKRKRTDLVKVGNELSC